MEISAASRRRGPLRTSVWLSKSATAVSPERPRASIPASRITGGAVVLVPAKTGLLPVWACGLGRTLLAVEVRNAYWRQFHAMRVQAFNTTVFPRDSTAKPLHIRTTRSSKGEAGRCWDCILRIFRRWGHSGRNHGGSSNGWRRRRLWDLNENCLIGGL